MTATSSRSALIAAAGLVAVAALAVALFLPRFNCRTGTRLARDAPPPAGSPNGWVCVSGDVRYVPDDRMPLKGGIAFGGIAVAGLLVLAAGRAPDRTRDQTVPPSR